MSDSKPQIKLPHHTAPMEYGDFLDKILMTLYKLSKPSSSKEIKQKEGSLPEEETIGRGASFLVYLGLAEEKGGRGNFELTPPGRKIAVEAAQGKTDEASKLWKENLAQNPLYGYIKNFIHEKGGGVKGSSIGLGEYLRDLAGAKWTSYFVKEGGKRLCALYQSKGLLQFDVTADEIMLPKEGEVIPPLVPPGGGQGGQGTGTQGQNIPPPPPQPPQIPPAIATNISINVTVDTKDDKSVSNLIDVIRALRGEKVEREKRNDAGQ